MKKKLNSFSSKIINIYDQENFINKLIRKLIVIYEKYRIIFNRKILKLKEVVLVYDCKVSPATKGDFFQLLILLRTLQALNFKVRIIVVTGEYRNSWYIRYNNVSRKSYLKYMNSMMKVVSLKGKAIMKYMSWLEYKEYKKRINYKKTFVLFDWKVNIRRPIYTHDTNLMNYLLNKDTELQNQVLLKSKDIKIKLKKLLPSKCIAIGCRYESKKIGTSRNISKNSFIKLIKKVNIALPKQKKIIISDRKGCNYFKKISKENSLKCLFSKDFSPDYLGDGKIILNSSVFFQLKGGGIMEFAKFSKLPFLISQSTKDNLSCEYQWKKNRESSWHKSNQLYYRTKGDAAFFCKKFDEFRLNNPQLK